MPLLNIFLYLLNSLDKTLIKYWTMERKYWKSQRNLSVQKCGNHGTVPKWVILSCVNMKYCIFVHRFNDRLLSEFEISV